MRQSFRSRRRLRYPTCPAAFCSRSRPPPQPAWMAAPGWIPSTIRAPSRPMPPLRLPTTDVSLALFDFTIANGAAKLIADAIFGEDESLSGAASQAKAVGMQGGNDAIGSGDTLINDGEIELSAPGRHEWRLGLGSPCSVSTHLCSICSWTEPWQMRVSARRPRSWASKAATMVMQRPPTGTTSSAAAAPSPAWPRQTPPRPACQCRYRRYRLQTAHQPASRWRR